MSPPRIVLWINASSHVLWINAPPHVLWINAAAEQGGDLQVDGSGARRRSTGGWQQSKGDPTGELLERYRKQDAARAGFRQ
jgi:hypothetical protein